MRLDRRSFIKLGGLAAAGLATISPEALATPTPMQLTTSRAQQAWAITVANDSTTPPDFLTDQSMPFCDKNEIIKTNGMQLIIDDLQFPNKSRIHIRDTEIIYRVIEKRRLIEQFGNMFPNWRDTLIRIPVYWALHHELHRINPEENNFTEEYAKELTGYLMKVPTSRIKTDISKQIETMDSRVKGRLQEES